jgi:hypothetical protein
MQPDVSDGAATLSVVLEGLGGQTNVRLSRWAELPLAEVPALLGGGAVGSLAQAADRISARTTDSSSALTTDCCQSLLLIVGYLRPRDQRHALVLRGGPAGESGRLGRPIGPRGRCRVTRYRRPRPSALAPSRCNRAHHVTSKGGLTPPANGRILSPSDSLPRWPPELQAKLRRPHLR